MTNAERINAHNAELREAIGIAEALPDASGGDDTMVGIWVLNEVLDLPEFDYYFNFVLTNVADSPQFYNLWSPGDGGLSYIDVDGGEATTYYDGAWISPEWRTITITEEPTDAECIAWLKANARKATYEDGFAEGEKAILSTYIDWAVSAVSASCIVDFNSDCNYYAKIWVQIAENMSGEEHMEEFVLAPYDSYSISTEEMGWEVRESQWSVNVSIMGFSKDGEF
jgi:hypothetical protein